MSINIPKLQIKTLKEQYRILRAENANITDELNTYKERNRHLEERKIELEEENRELRRRIEENGSTCSESKIKTEFTQEEKKRAERYDPR